ncbi:hypothetical protein GGI35DRAFT_21864 [Trichoderma velutinum]
MSVSAGMSATVLGRVKACNACRQLKLRCDAHPDNYGPCSRCRRTQRDCVVSASFKRRTRQTKADLQRELDRLRSQYESNQSPNSTSSSGQPYAGSAGLSPGNLSSGKRSKLSDAGQLLDTAADGEGFNAGVDDQPLGTDSPETAKSASIPTSSWEDGHSRTAQDSVMPLHTSIEAVCLPPTTPSKTYEPQTVSRTLECVELSPRKINGCFSMFCEHYAPAVSGIFDPEKTPNQIYEYSAFLFWAVIYVGARKYHKDPTIVEALALPLARLTRESLFDPEHAISTLQAVLILCLWPLPVDSTFKDQTHAIAGAAMQLAIQKGLPYSSRKQDFVRVALRQPEGDKLFRARLWVYCLIVFQCTSLYDGFHFPRTIDPPGIQHDYSIFSGLPFHVLYQHRLHRVLTEAFTSIMRTTNLDSTEDSALLNSMIVHFDSQTLQVSPREHDELGRFTLGCARLLIRAFHFFSTPDSERNSGILLTYYISCELIQTAVRLDKSQDFALYCSQSQARAIACAAACILRVQRSDLRTQINTDLGEDMYFESIRMSKKRSIQNNDLDSRIATILTQLWSSTRVFKFKDGSTDGLRLFLRGRLSLSVLFDSFWWWRAEFGGKSNPYVEQEPDRMPSSSTGVGEPSTSALGTQMLDSTLDLALTTAQLSPSEFLADASDIPDWNWEGLGDVNWNWL